MSLLGKNCWTVVDIRVVANVDNGNCRRWVTAVCRHCEYKLDERLHYFLKRDDCPRCADSHWSKGSL